VGLLSPIGSDGRRHVYEPLREELERQRRIFEMEQAAETAPGRLRLAR
jgi:hypothetical protein